MTWHKRSIKSVWVLGSTSDVARSLCWELAERGCQRFHLIARNTIKNENFANELEHCFGVVVSRQHTDLLIDANLNNENLYEVGEFDLYLITAGSLGDAELARVDADEALLITTANYTGLIRWITSITTSDRLTKQSRLWVFSSVAGDRGRPSNYHYGAAKAALTTFCEGLLLRCNGKQFAVRIIKAGYIATPMTSGKVPEALSLSPRTVARYLLRNPNRRGIEYLPFWWLPLMVIVRLLPSFVASKL